MRVASVVLVACALLMCGAGQSLAKDLIYNFTMSFDPGWTGTGDWAWGQPAGAGNDPSSGYTGPCVYGYNLAGTYPNNLPAQTLTTGAIDCSNLSNTTLVFWRWLGVENSTYDHASVLVSNDGANWTSVWQHVGSTLQDTAWVRVEYDISAVADGHSTVYIRWVMGPTDASVTYSGWNIDDVQIWADTPDVPLQILAWVPYAGLDEEYRNTLAALSSQFGDYVVTESFTDSAAVLETELEGKQVFLVPEPEQAASATLSAMGTEFSSVLQDFTAAGGTVVVLCEWSTYQGFLTATGLMSATYAAGHYPGQALPVVLTSHPLATGLGATVEAQDATAAYTIGPEATSIIEDGYGNTVVACRDIGYGAVVLMGYDFYAYDDDAARVLANAVRYPRSTVDILLYGEAGWLNAGRQALSRLGYRYTLATSTTLDTLLASRDWDLVVVDAPSNRPNSGFNELISYVKGGGRLALSTWRLTQLSDLCDVLGVSAVETFEEGVPPIYRWDPTHALFTAPRSVPDLTTWLDPGYVADADRLKPVATGATAVAGFTATPSEEQAALVIGSGGKTIVNGFLWDEAVQDDDADGVSDCVELVMNEVLFLLRRPDVDFSAAPRACLTNQGVDFTDLSSSDCTAWTWDFGDAQTSNEQNPTHAYAKPGYYSVLLSAANDWAEATTGKHWYIAVGFPDVALPTLPGQWEFVVFHSVLSCVMADIVGGYPDGTYQPTGSIDRAQMSVFISRALAGGDGNIPDPSVVTFPDVTDTHWAYKWVEYAHDNGIVGGYPDGTYQPDNVVDRGQMAVFIARAMAHGDAGVPDPVGDPTFPDVTPDNEWAWAYKYVEYITDQGITSGYGDGYHPEYVCTRDQMAIYVQRAFDLPMQQP